MGICHLFSCQGTKGAVSHEKSPSSAEQAQAGRRKERVLLSSPGLGQTNPLDEVFDLNLCQQYFLENDPSSEQVALAKSIILSYLEAIEKKALFGTDIELSKDGERPCFNKQDKGLESYLLSHSSSKRCNVAIGMLMMELILAQQEVSGRQVLCQVALKVGKAIQEKKNNITSNPINSSSSMNQAIVALMRSAYVEKNSLAKGVPLYETIGSKPIFSRKVDLLQVSDVYARMVQGLQDPRQEDLLVARNLLGDLANFSLSLMPDTSMARSIEQGSPDFLTSLLAQEWHQSQSSQWLAAQPPLTDLKQQEIAIRAEEVLQSEEESLDKSKRQSNQSLAFEPFPTMDLFFHFDCDGTFPTA
jgi:hypothetical protein